MFQDNFLSATVTDRKGSDFSIKGLILCFNPQSRERDFRLCLWKKKCKIMLRLEVMMTHLDHFIMYLGNYFVIRCDGLGRYNKGTRHTILSSEVYK